MPEDETFSPQLANDPDEGCQEYCAHSPHSDYENNLDEYTQDFSLKKYLRNIKTELSNSQLFEDEDVVQSDNGIEDQPNFLSASTLIEIEGIDNDCDNQSFFQQSIKKSSSEQKLETQPKNESVKHSCALCNKVNCRESNLLKHLKSVHKISQERSTGQMDEKEHDCCNECLLLFPSRNELQSHKKDQHSSSSSFYQCLECKKNFSSKHACKLHTKAIHQKQSFPCSDCDKVFTFIHNLEKHHNAVHKKTTV